MKLLTIFLLCHNRPDRAVEAIKSILQQTNSNFNFIVSDNSSNDLLSNLVKDKFPLIKYISQSNKNFTSFFSHFSSLLLESKTQYVAMFHDDDIMEPNFVAVVLNKIESTSNNIAAIATNASYIDVDGSNSRDGLSFTKKEEEVKYSRKSEILQQYLAWDFGGTAPFCSYVYNLECLQGLSLEYDRGRKYCDTIFLMDVVSKGAILWINRPLVKVRRHNDNISSSCGILDYKAFIFVIKNECSSVSKVYLKEYKFRNLYYVLKRQGKWPLPALKYLSCNMLKVMFYSKSFRNAIFMKIIKVFWR